MKDPIIKSFPIVLFAGFVLFVIIFAWVAGPPGGEVSAWIEGIDDPIERGCAYIAIAIGIHAFVTFLKSTK